MCSPLFIRSRIAAALLLCCCMYGCATAPDRNGVEREADKTVSPAAVTLYERATAAMAAGEDVESRALFSDFLSRYPDFSGAHVNLAILEIRQGNDGAAEQHISRALELDPHHAAALNQLGILRRRQGRFAEAETAYVAAIAADGNYALPHFNLGVLNELYLRRLPQALRHFLKFQELGGEDSRVAKWIVDLERRIEAQRRTANVTE